jgi:hypothetical protein
MTTNYQHLLSNTKLFPWPSTKKGQGFFIPCLNTHEMTKLGMSAALRSRVFNAKAHIAVRDGLIGVWFFR